MIITIFFALASISLIIFVPIYLKKKNNLYKYKPQEKMSLKKQKKTIKNIPICICFGISIGMLVGMGIGATIKKNGNK